MLSSHRRLFAFDHWANLAALDAVAPVADHVPRSVAWLNHILGASRVWLARITGATMPFGANPAFDTAALRIQFDLASNEWHAFLATQTDVDLTRVIQYTNLKGVPFESPLGDILTHVPLHGQHHRGQINADLRAAGVTPPVIDFIHASRSGALPAIS
jgi:uncharacterized damage-inducible protein DinB